MTSVASTASHPGKRAAGSEDPQATAAEVLARQSQYVAAAVRQHLARCAAEPQHPAMAAFLAETERLGSVNSPAAQAAAKRLLIDGAIEMLRRVQGHADLCRPVAL